MTDQKMDFMEFVREMNKNGYEEEDVREFAHEVKKHLYLLPFMMDSKGVNIVSHINGTITFVNSRFPGKVEVGDVWICSTECTGNVYYAMPLFKVTPSFLINLDDDVRNGLIDSLWARNRKMFESDFAERYKAEVHENAAEEVRSELEGIIETLRSDKAELEDQLRQTRLLMQSGILNERQPSDETIELGSDDSDDTVELGSEDTVRKETVKDVQHTVPSIPVTVNRSAPGIPEIMTPDRRDRQLLSIRYDVIRTGEETIFSESFTDPRYFVHISPDCKMLVIRPNPFGSALCMNRRIRLKGLGKLSPFTEQKQLAAEYSNIYEGMNVYL